MDRLSQLPDDILVHIVSFLSTEDAYKTSLLCKHWRRHWWLYVDSLDFNTCAYIKPHDLKYPAHLKLDEPALKRRFFEWLSKALRSLQDHVEEETSVLNKLRIQLPLYFSEQSQKRIVEEWLSYAFARRVRSLELDLLLYSDAQYMVDYDPRSLGFGTETDMSCLGSLSLSGIQVAREDIDSILLKCPFLEHLKVCHSDRLLSVEISSSTLALKHLEIIGCKFFECVVVRDTCLVSLNISQLMNLVVENNPKLVSVCTGWYIGNVSILQMLSSCLLRLQILTLHLGYEHDEGFDQVPQLIELKQLTLLVAPLREDLLFRLTTMLNLSPNLEKLVLDLINPKFDGKVEYKNVPKVHLRHLKVVEVRGYCGEKAEDEFFMYVLKHVVTPIERIIFDPHTLTYDNISLKKGWKIETDKRRVEMFKRLIPSSVKFIVLQIHRIHRIH